jgi:tRNA U34 5-methylaminomethyl-2-thiouridine-forming methyltransferase MnmC
MERQIKLSNDGSHTIYNETIDEHYHSTFGAITESQHIFIQNGLNFINTNPVRILEIGFGTGLNALLTLENAILQNRKIYYVAIELYPLEIEVIQKLNYSKLINQKFENDFLAFHNCNWGEDIKLNNNFTLYKILGNAINVDFPENFDLVYFDAFSPDKQPELWTIELFLKLYKSLNKNGILTTYCAKGEVKRNLKEAGFTIERIPGPPGKRHMIRAIKGIGS